VIGEKLVAFLMTPLAASTRLARSVDLHGAEEVADAFADAASGWRSLLPRLTITVWAVVFY